ncbi:unnamed protein product, partial [Iphiclides podalirius]
MVPNISHCVPDSGDMPNTQNAITYAEKYRVSPVRVAAAPAGTGGETNERNRDTTVLQSYNSCQLMIDDRKI